MLMITADNIMEKRFRFQLISQVNFSFFFFRDGVGGERHAKLICLKMTDGNARQIEKECLIGVGVHKTSCERFQCFCLFVLFCF